MRGLMITAAFVLAVPASADEQVWTSDQAGTHLEAMETIVEALCPFEDRFKRTECMDSMPNLSFAFAACGTAFEDAPQQYACYTLVRETWTSEAFEKLRPDLKTAD